MLEEKIRSKKAKIGVVGLGYVGLPLAVSFLKEGFVVIGLDISKERVKLLKKGKSYIDDVQDDEIKPFVKNGKFILTTEYSKLKDADAINICVPTPFTTTKDPDLKYVIDASERIGEVLKKEQIVILKSTTYPETTEKVVLPILEKKSGLRAGKDFYLAFAPERVDPGNKKFPPRTIPAVVGGYTKKGTKLTALLYSQIVDRVVPVSNPRVAEMTKLLENIFRNVNIALVNELALLCERMGGVDMWEVIEAASTKPFGFMPFYPGPGLGGHCIPIDPYYLSWKAREYDFHTSFIELAAKVNEDMPYHVIQKLQDVLNKNGIVLKNARVLILGVSFKENISDTRNSPALKIMSLLMYRVKKLVYNDPYVPSVSVDGKNFDSKKLTKQLLKGIDVVLITAAHRDYDYRWIVKNSRIVLDTRNATKNIRARNLFKLGLRK